MTSLLARHLFVVPWLFAASAALAQDSCLLAGRVNAESQWAPRFKGVELLNASGKRVTGAGANALASVKQARITQPALLSACNGKQPITKGDDSPVAAKAPVPALAAGPELLAVESVRLLPLNAGGAWVEVKLAALAPQRVVMLTR